jgi:hypothetical protein
MPEAIPRKPRTVHFCILKEKKPIVKDSDARRAAAPKEHAGAGNLFLGERLYRCGALLRKIISNADFSFLFQRF